MKPLIILAGPTASGKTALSIELAKRLNGEIISADSIQVYRGMDIGTAKVTKDEMDGVVHHFVDIIEPDEEWNVMRFCELARAAIDDICARGKVPIVVGGTGFYIHALAYGAEFDEEPEDTSLRTSLEKLTEAELHEKLRTVDPESAEAIHPNNKKRVIRALEYFEHTGEKISVLNARLKQKPSPYQLAYLVLDMPRPILYERIDKRVDLMMEAGLVEEVRQLKAKGYTKDMVSMKGLGYKEILDALDGNNTLEEAVYILKRDTRHFAKRQITWWKGEKEAVFLPCDPRDTLLERALAIIKEKGITT